MSTGFALPTVITKRVKTLNSGPVTNDVVYVCPANCITEVFLSHLFASVLLQISSIVLVRAGGTQPITKTIGTLISSAGNATYLPLSINANTNTSESNIVSGEGVNSFSGNVQLLDVQKYGSSFKMFPNDYFVVNYNGILSGGELVYSTVEVFGQG